MTQEALIRQLQISCLGLDPIDPLRLLVDDVIEALAQTQEPWCMKMNGSKTKCKDCPDEPPQRTEQNFCPRCGKRTADLTTIHTCTPPHD